MAVDRVMIIGIAGGSGSGKTSVANALQQKIGFEHTLLITEDSYYKDLSGMPFDERQNVNYDHPDAIDFQLLATHLRKLKTCKNVTLPTYDFSTHTRANEGCLFRSKPLIIVEGILIYAIPAIRDICDLKMFLQTPDDLRLIRRFQRDVTVRKRSAESVIKQYLQTVRPMHRKFVEPSMAWADLIIDGENRLSEVVELVSHQIYSMIRNANE